MTPMTILLTTHTRLNNAKTILETLRKQRLKPTLFLWDNSETDWDCGHIDWRIRSTPNTKVAGRWWMIAQAESDDVISLDDDICPADDLMTAKIVDFLDGNPDSLIGPRRRPVEKGRRASLFAGKTSGCRLRDESAPNIFSEGNSQQCPNASYF